MASENVSTGTSVNSNMATNNEAVSKMMAANLRKLQDELKAEREARAKIEKERMELEEKSKEEMANRQRIESEFKLAQDRLGSYIDRDREMLESIYTGEMRPVIDSIVKADEKLALPFQDFDQQIHEDIASAFNENKRKKSTFDVVRAMASAHAMKSSELENLFQTNRKWEEDMHQMKVEHESLASKAKEMEDLKNKEIEDLKSLLADLKKKYEHSQDNINNTESHFTDDNAMSSSSSSSTPIETGMPPPAFQQSQTIMATASRNPTARSRGYGTLFDVTPTSDWRKYASGDAQFRMMGEPIDTQRNDVYEG